MKGLRRLDVFPKFDVKFEQDARQRTVLGAVLTVASMAVVALLVIGEVRYFFSTVEQHEMFVDPVIGGDMDVTVNITFPHVPCDFITADAVDSFGAFAAIAADDVQKSRVDAATLRVLSAARPVVDEQKKLTKAIDPDGAEKENCPSCYGAEADPGQCCHTCDEVRAAYQRKGWGFNADDISVEQCARERLEGAAAVSGHEGCNINARLRVARVTGNIHFVPGRMFTSGAAHHHDFMGAAVAALNLSHIVNTLEFGERFPGQANPLDGVANLRGSRDPAEAVSGRFSYFVKVVPTRYQAASFFGSGGVLESNQYSVTHHFTPRAHGGENARMAPGVFITYDLSPIKVHIFETHPHASFLHLVLQLCAVGGGVFTVAGIVDALFFHGIRRMQHKMAQGKQI